MVNEIRPTDGELEDFDPEKEATALPNHPLVSVEIRRLSILTICASTSSAMISKNAKMNVCFSWKKYIRKS